MAAAASSSVCTPRPAKLNINQLRCPAALATKTLTRAAVVNIAAAHSESDDSSYTGEEESDDDDDDDDDDYDDDDDEAEFVGAVPVGLEGKDAVDAFSFLMGSHVPAERDKLGRKRKIRGNTGGMGKQKKTTSTRSDPKLLATSLKTCVSACEICCNPKFCKI